MKLEPQCYCLDIKPPTPIHRYLSLNILLLVLYRARRTFSIEIVAALGILCSL